MKIFNKKGKKFTSLFVKKFFISVIALIVSGVFCVWLMQYNFWDFMTDKFYEDKEIAIYGTSVLPDNYKELDKDRVLNNGGWIEVLQNNEVVDVIGEKKDDTVLYNSNLLTHMNEKGELYVMDELEPISSGYTTKVYDEGLKDTYLVKIPKWDMVLLNYIDRMIESDINDKEWDEFALANMKVIFIPLILGIIAFVTIIGTHIFFAIRSIKKPLAQIQTAIDEFGNGNMDAKIDFHSFREFNQIKDNFNYMIDKIDKAEKERLKLEESKKNMIRDISHDIKTPITSILGYSKAIVEKEDMSEEERDTYLGYIYNKTVRIDYLVNELFKFVELDSSNYKLNKVKKDYSEFIREVVLLHYKDIEDKGFNLELDIDEKEILIEFDDKNMERAVSNLIVNAIKYNDEKTNLKISVKEAEDEIITIVEDDGIGIEKEISNVIFEEFVRVDKSRNSKGGSGLGLAISKKIVELHNGSISLESEIGKGSKFIIKIPR
ncbi:MAG: ATP-binding protein [Peptostreptococcaceae bacterium]